MIPFPLNTNNIESKSTGTLVFIQGLWYVIASPSNTSYLNQRALLIWNGPTSAFAWCHFDGMFNDDCDVSNPNFNTHAIMRSRIVFSVANTVLHDEIVKLICMYDGCNEVTADTYKNMETNDMKRVMNLPMLHTTCSTQKYMKLFPGTKCERINKKVYKKKARKKN
jgi:hypothetical protein